MSTFDTHGGHFSPKDYTRVNEGGSHEENPYGGVQLGVDPEGNPNLLEEGEPVYKDYVFSDNIRAKESFLEENNLPKSYRDKLYSEIADAFVDEAEERPLDPISRNGLEAMLSRLAQAQEGQKAEQQQKELEKILGEMTPEELDQLEASLVSQEQPAPETVPPEYYPEEEISQPVEQVPMMACGGKVHKFRQGGPEGDEWDYKISRIMPLPPILDPAVSSAYTMQDMANDIFKPVGNPFGVDLSTYSETVPEENIPTILPVADVSSNTKASVQKALLDEQARALPSVLPQSTSLAGTLPTRKRTRKRNWLDAYETDSTASTNSGMLPTVSRYASALGSGLLGLYNMTQQPDHYEVSRAVPYVPSGSINLQTQRYVPIDPNIILNEQLAQSNATARALNTGSPSTAANLIALDNNTTRNIGTGYIQGVQANNQQRNAVIGANNAAEAQRAQFDFGVEQQRAAALAAAQRQNIQNELMMQRLNNLAESEKYQTIAGHLGAGLESLANIGRENFALNQIRSNPALLKYYMGQNGSVLRKCGGSLLKKYKK